MITRNLLDVANALVKKRWYSVHHTTNTHPIGTLPFLQVANAAFMHRNIINYPCL